VRVLYRIMLAVRILVIGMCKEYSLCTHVRVLYRIMLAVRILVVGMCKEYNSSGGGRDVNRL